MSDRPLTVDEKFHAYTVPKIDKNTRTVIVATMNHNGSCEVTMDGQDLDIAWLLKLADHRLNELLQTKKVKE